ncbi:LysR family transcriptional regulator [Nannocystaceae bacterium ST9]
MSRLVEMEVFVAVVRAGSFAAAGSKLELSPSYASKLIARLEQRLNTRLLHRTTRSLALTGVGERFYADCLRALEQIEDAERTASATPGVARGRLRVTVPTGLGHEWLSCTLAQFVEANPEVQLDTVYVDRHVDLVAEGFDVAVRVGLMRDSSLIARRLATTRVALVASPGFVAAHVAAHGPIDEPEALAELACLVYAFDRAPASWTLERGDERRSVSISGPMVANSGRALVDAATHGLGIAYVPDIHSARQLAAGELVRVLPDWSSELPIHAVYPSSRLLPAKVRLFIDHLVEHLREPGWRSLAPE